MKKLLINKHKSTDDKTLRDFLKLTAEIRREIPETGKKVDVVKLIKKWR